MRHNLFALVPFFALILIALLVNAEVRENTIVTTFPYLKVLVEKIAGPDWKIESIVPSGVDPHEYHLSERDISLLRKADVIVITKHTHFENKIIELVKIGELKPKRLVVGDDIEGIRLLINPATGNLNIHEIFYDPYNLLQLANEIKNVLVSLDSLNSDKYEARFLELNAIINQLISEYGGKMRGKALGSSPLVQYAVHWLGVNLVDLLEPEHEVPVSAQELKRLEDGVKRGFYDYVVIRGLFSSGKWRPATETDEYLYKLARESNVKIIVVPDILSGDPDIVRSLYKLALEPFPGEPEKTTHVPTSVYIIIGVISIILVSSVVLLSRSGRS